MLRDTLTAMLRPVVEGLGYVLWELEYVARTGQRLACGCSSTREAGITVDDCERVSRAVSELLDAEDPVPGQYTLEVSSPGLDRPLRTPEHFAPYVGADVFVELAQPLDGRRRFLGPLAAAGAGTIEVEVDGRRFVLPIDRNSQGAPGAASLIPALREDDR